MILDTNMLGLMLSDLNSEIKYKLWKYVEHDFDQDLLEYNCNGADICIIFAGAVIWSSANQEELEPMELKKSIELNEREPFEQHVRLLVNDRINTLKHLEL